MKPTLKLFLLLAVFLPLLFFTSCDDDDDMKLPDGTKPEALIGKWKSPLSHYIASDLSYYKIYEFTPEELLVITEEYEWIRSEQEYHYCSADTARNKWTYYEEKIYLLEKWNKSTFFGSIPLNEVAQDYIRISGTTYYHSDRNDNMKMPGGIKSELLIGTWQSAMLSISSNSEYYYRKTYDFTTDKLYVTIDNYKKESEEEYIYINSDISNLYRLDL